ncbi:MAG: four helix bundle protein [Candidatus Cloacimonetes bacterium]|nr:four helix bundle protein [Candidatus Cloacimonadota bacterium]
MISKMNYYTRREGAARNSRKEYIQFLYIALGSIAEIETQLIIANNLKYLKSKQLKIDIEKIKRKLIKLIQSLKKQE